MRTRVLTNPSNKGQLYDLPGLRGTALEAETLQWSCQQKHWCRVFPNNFRPLCQRCHLQNVYNLQVGVFHSMSKVWQQHICRQVKFNCCYHSEILLAATTGRHSAAAGVTADTRSASFSTGIPKWRDLFKSRLYLALTGEPWGVFCEEFGENWPRYNGTVLYTVYWVLHYFFGLWRIVSPTSQFRFVQCEFSARYQAQNWFDKFIELILWFYGNLTI